MIRAVQYSVDNGGGDNESHWINTPPSVIAELSESRKRNHTQRAREMINKALSKLEEAKAKADLVDLQRPFGLLEGQASEDIWRLILDYVHDLEDVILLRDTCVLFRDLLDRKYTVFRIMQFNKVILKFANKLGGLRTILNLRLVCKASAKAVQEYFLKDPPADLKPQLGFCADPEMMRRDFWGENIILRKDFRSGELPPFIDDIDLREDPEYAMSLPNLRANFQRLVDDNNAGAKIRKFHFLGTYNSLRKWVAMMPNLEELQVWFHVEFLEATDRSQLAHLELLPFPTCPKLKKFKNFNGVAFPAPFLSQIFLANPTILEVIQEFFGIVNDDVDEEGWSQRDQEEFRQLLNSMNTLHLLERFEIHGSLTKPTPLQLIEFRFGWPLKSLTLKIRGGEWGRQERDFRGISSRTLFAFINSFQETLEELEVEWKMPDTGGFLNVTKVTKLTWKFWPDFISFDFIIALEKLQYLDMDLGACFRQIASRYNVSTEWFIKRKNLPRLFPALKRIREKGSQWWLIWKA